MSRNTSHDGQKNPKQELSPQTLFCEASVSRKHSPQGLSLRHYLAAAQTWASTPRKHPAQRLSTKTPFCDIKNLRFPCQKTPRAKSFNTQKLFKFMFDSENTSQRNLGFHDQKHPRTFLEDTALRHQKPTFSCPENAPARSFCQGAVSDTQNLAFKSKFGCPEHQLEKLKLSCPENTPRRDFLRRHALRHQKLTLSCPENAPCEIFCQGAVCRHLNLPFKSKF